MRTTLLLDDAVLRIRELIRHHQHHFGPSRWKRLRLEATDLALGRSSRQPSAPGR